MHPSPSRTYRRLPPLSQLRAFEAAARHRSFKEAANELSVTPAAVSHQIRDLEAWLGSPLFERRTRQVVPTRQAQLLYPVLREGFDAFAQAIGAIAALPGDSVVTLSATPAFVTQWLLPRLPRFNERHPGIELQIHAGDEPVDLARGAADLAIRYGNGPYPEHEAIELAADRFVPVASPTLALREPADLASHRLIHFEWKRARAGLPAWPAWLRKAGLGHVDASRGLRFSEEVHAIQAAIAGQGVALLSLTLLRQEMLRGVLVSPFGPALPGPRYHLLRHERRHARDADDAVRQWILEEFGVIADRG